MLRGVQGTKWARRGGVEAAARARVGDGRGVRPGGARRARHAADTACSGGCAVSLLRYEETRRQGRERERGQRGRHGAASPRPLCRHDVVRMADAVTSPSTATPATIWLPPACGVIVAKRGMQWRHQFDQCTLHCSD